MIVIAGMMVVGWGTANSLATLLQAFKMIHNHSAHDVSTGFFEIRMGSFLASLWFGITTTDIYLMVPNAIGIIASTITLAIARWVKETQ